MWSLEKRIAVLCILSLFYTGGVEASNLTAEGSENCCRMECPFPELPLNFYIEAKFGAFWFTNGLMNSLFPDWSNNYGGEFGLIFYRWFGLSLNYGFTKKNGQAVIDCTNCHSFILDNEVIYCTHRMTLTYQNLDVIGKVFWPCRNYFKPYLGIGPRVLFLRSCDDSPYLARALSGMGIGGMITGGAHIGYSTIYVDPYVEYGFVQMGMCPCDASCCYQGRFDNLSFGVGVGFRY